MKIAIVDIETSGLDPKKHEIIEIGAVIFEADLVNKTFIISDALSVKVKPRFPKEGDPKAYEVNGYNRVDWLNSISLKEAMCLLSEKTRGCAFCAHNMIFDWSFLLEASWKTKIPLNFGYHKIDLYSLASGCIMNFFSYSGSLQTICQYLKITPEPKIHRAFQGAMIEYEVYRKLMS